MEYPLHAISPTPAGKNKNAKCSIRKLKISSIILTLMIPLSKQKSNIIIPITFPGIGSLNILWTALPKKQISIIIPICLNIFTSITSNNICFSIAQLSVCFFYTEEYHNYKVVNLLKTIFNARYFLIKADFKL